MILCIAEIAEHILGVLDSEIIWSLVDELSKIERIDQLILNIFIFEVRLVQLFLLIFIFLQQQITITAR